MKKNVFFALCAAVAMLMLASCSENNSLAIEEPVIEEPYTEPITVFSTSVEPIQQNAPSGPKRTSAERNGTKFPFFWTKNDRIWVKNTDNKFYESHTIRKNVEKEEPTEKVAAGYFDIHGVFDGASYQVFYLGQAHNVSEGASAAHGTKENDVYVTIAKEQGQMKVEHMDHFGLAGDCGTATATKQSDGTYKFMLDHKASYLAIYPTKNSSIAKNITISKLEITSNKPLAGDFHFSDGSLLNKSPEENGNKSYTINFKTGTGEYEYGFPLETTNNKEKGIYVVIPPGEHELTLKFYLFDEYHQKREVVKEYNNYNYGENKFVRLSPVLDADFPDIPLYEDVWYKWDAASPYVFTVSNQNLNVAAPDTAYVSCRYMPNVNEVWWYLKNGDVRWDETTEYKVKCYVKVQEYDDYGDLVWKRKLVEKTRTGGIWIKRKAVILDGEGGTTKCGHASHHGDGPYFCENHAYYGKAIGGVDVPGWYDFRIDREHDNDFNTDIAPNYYAGKPANTQDYFFLPALGFYDGTTISEIEDIPAYQRVQTGYYWTRNVQPADAGATTDQKKQTPAYYLQFNKHGLHINETSGHRNKGYVAGDGWFH